jgi:hypothetical protein
MQETIKKLTDDPRFHLTGSRFMAEKYPDYFNLSQETDWDFAVQLREGIFEELHDLGFTEIIDYEREEFLPQFSFESVAVFKKGGIDVLVKGDLSLYLKLFDSLSVTEYNLHDKKSSKIHWPDNDPIWNHAYEEWLQAFRMRTTKYLSLIDQILHNNIKGI